MRIEVDLDRGARSPEPDPAAGRPGAPAPVAPVDSLDPAGLSSIDHLAAAAPELLDGDGLEADRSDADRCDADALLDQALARARRGDDDGFIQLYRALQPRLLRYLRIRAGDGAEDVAAETWLQVVRDVSHFVGSADSFRGWLFTIARNRCVDAARARAARPSVPVPDVHMYVTATSESAESRAMESMSTQQALRLVATLPAEQAEMVALRVVAGLDVATVAEMVGKSPGAVRVAVHRALATLSGRPGLTPLEGVS